jgi:hypothetical protein
MVTASLSSYIENLWFSRGDSGERFPPSVEMSPQEAWWVVTETIRGVFSSFVHHCRQTFDLFLVLLQDFSFGLCLARFSFSAFLRLLFVTGLRSFLETRPPSCTSPPDFKDLNWPSQGPFLLEIV